MPHPRGATWLRVLSEFAVIVVGVLVALGVENWAIGRSERRSELRYLESLAEDLRDEERLLSGLLLPNLAGAEAALQKLAPIVRSQVPFPDDTIALLQAVSVSTRSFSQLGRSTTFDELQSTGALRLLRSAEVRASLLEYYSTRTLVESRADRRASGYEAVVWGLIPATPRGEPTTEELRAYGLQHAVTGMLSPEFQLAMNRHFSYVEAVETTLQRVWDHGQALLPLIEHEVSGLK